MKYLIIILALMVGYASATTLILIGYRVPAGKNVSHPMTTVSRKVDDDLHQLRLLLAWDMAQILVEEGYWSFDLQSDELILRVGRVR